MSDKKSLIETVPLDKNGMLKPTTLDEQMKTADLLLKSGMFPSFAKSGPASLLQVIQSCVVMDLPIAQASSYFYNIKGKVTLFGDGPLLIVQRRSNTIEWIDEFYIDRDCKRISLENKNISSDVYGAICSIKKHGDEKVSETYFTMDNAKKAGLLGSMTWQNYPKLMMKYKARMEGLKNKFAEYLQGVDCAEYTHDTLPSENLVESQIDGPIEIEDQPANLESRFENIASVEPMDKNGITYKQCPPQTVELVTPKPDIEAVDNFVSRTQEVMQQPIPEPIVLSKNEQSANDNAARIKAAVNKVNETFDTQQQPPQTIVQTPAPIIAETPPINAAPVNDVNFVKYGAHSGKSLDSIPRQELISYFNSLVASNPTPEGDIFELMTQINNYLT